MQPAYYENLEEIQNKYWSMLDDAVTNRGSPFRIPVFICAHQDEVDGRIVVLENQIEKIIITISY
jgi:3-hydroxyisobutyrate dehydrogenase